jgi:hypothetical protein
MQNAIPASQRLLSITKTDRYMEIVATYCETYVKHKYTQCRKITFLVFRAGGIET